MKSWRFCQKPKRECSRPIIYRATVTNSIQPTKVSPKRKIYHRAAENAEKSWVFGSSAAKTNHGDTEYTEKIQFAFSVSSVNSVVRTVLTIRREVSAESASRAASGVLPSPGGPGYGNQIGSRPCPRRDSSSNCTSSQNPCG